MIMPKRLLVAIDDSAASERAVTYVAQMLEGQQAVQILLLHVPAPMPPRFLEFGGAEDPVQERRGQAQLKTAQARWVEEVQQAVQPLFAKAQSILYAAQIPEAAVKTQLAIPPRDQSLDASILEAAHAHQCETIVVGRESFSWLQELIQGHLADTLLQRTDDFTLWVVQ